MLVAALTGNIGMGKSLVLTAFEEQGAFTLSTDLIVADLLKRKEVIENAKFLLGSGVVDEQGGLDRKKVADIIFTDDDMRRAFEGMIHPLVMGEVQRRVEESGAEVAVVEVPMLFESALEDRFDRKIAVYADENVAIDRLTAAGMDREDIVRRLVCQMPIAEKISRSDYTIDNNGSPEEMKPKVRQIYRVLMAEVAG